ncbi:HsdM family class I SAM-dependent methyltransferase [Ligilactobacillus salivarius]|uniref:site-specific DNA-methyltransferase (adenine-specific) n=1 Tax=Ligilactobacillus salivarius TaxID=1624 RepID=A0A6N9ITB4_9LACO|nr:N-6 DNA methylase [Ligilactobacillus salivarius]MDM8283367.1 N-6 DNA methylase [Ligilactobacillus salivarius]MYY65054.1 N-6 DNA methylase [Ligilactobacillus salivarius]
MNWKLEKDVNEWVAYEFKKYGLVKLVDYNEESGMSEYMKESLKGSAKTKAKTNFGVPDLHVEKYNIPVVIEDKLKRSKLITKNKSGIKNDDNSIEYYAVNGALYYARNMIASEKYSEVIAVGVAGDNKENVTMDVYYVFGSAPTAYKELADVSSFSFLESQDSFDEFYKNAKLSEKEKHRLLIDSKETLNVYAKKLNKLMHNLNITAPQRVLYVSGMLLSMQHVSNSEGVKIDDGLVPDDLKGIQTNNDRDSKKVVSKIDTFLTTRGVPESKRKLMLASFKEISKDVQRDELTDTDKEVAKLINGQASTTKQIFVFIYEYIFKSIDGLGGSLDVMGEMYSEFLKYALGDGKELGIVLTPPYVTRMMAQILNVNKDSRVMDLATGSAGFLIASMEIMINDANRAYGKQTKKAIRAINTLKTKQLLGIELNAEMYTLATTNMILRGDGSSKIEKGNAFNRPESLFTDFKGNRILLNPPFSFKENGLPFILYGLDKLEKDGLGAIIIQDSAGSGQAEDTAKEILTKHTLLASIKMPPDLFEPMAGVQTSVYIFKAGTPHDYEKTVKFIDFRNDGYKRTKRGIIEINNPTQRYQDIIKIYKAGSKAKVASELWNLNDIVIEDFITDSGKDWNFEQHVVIDTTPTEEDFKKTISAYLSWKVSQIMQGGVDNG